MDKVLITIVVPSLGEKYDVLLPIYLTVRESIPLLTESLMEITGNRYSASGDEFLCGSDRQTIFEQIRTIKECGIQNGDCIYLF